MKLALFDLDGTINSSKARSDLVPDNVRDNSAWLVWHEAFRSERLNLPLITTAYRMYRAGYRPIVVSNRDQSLHQATQIHLSNSGFPRCPYVLRALDDNRRPNRWKADTIKTMLITLTSSVDNDEQVIVHHFDDDKKALKELEEHYSTHNKIMYIPHLVSFE